MSSSLVLCDIGFIGLGVMGKNLALNLADNGYKVAAFDLDSEKVASAIEQDERERGNAPQRIFPCTSYSQFLSQLCSPHLIILSVPAGDPVDDVCHQLIHAGIGADTIVVDTGNSLWTDTVEREKRYQGKFLFFSTAVSGGEVGARFGASLMPSGDFKAWARIAPMLKAIAAKVDPETGKPIERHEPGNPVLEGEPCATYIGEAGSGHYVKMVHNGIEYADMQLICEAYNIMRTGLAMSPVEIAKIFRQWNEGELNSYLIEISAEVLEYVEAETQQPLVDLILDKAGQKGTGLWTAVSSLQVGAPSPTITAAVYARALSTLKEDRVKASNILSGPTTEGIELNKEEVITQLHDALYCSKICAYAQGFQLMSIAAKEHGWNLDFSGIAKIWRAGCIIRAVFLQSITKAYQGNKNLSNLLMDPFFADQMAQFQGNWRRTIANAALMGIPVGAFSSSLSYYDSYRCAVLPANLLQGQRDYFGAHTFTRVDQAEGKKFHVAWSRKGRPLSAV